MLPGRVGGAPGTWQAASQQRVEVRRPARRRPRHRPACERPLAITSRCPPTFTTSTTLSTPDTSTTRPSHTAPTAGP